MFDSIHSIFKTPSKCVEWSYITFLVILLNSNSAGASYETNSIQSAADIYVKQTENLTSTYMEGIYDNCVSFLYAKEAKLCGEQDGGREKVYKERTHIKH